MQKATLPIRASSTGLHSAATRSGPGKSAPALRGALLRLPSR